MRQRYKGSIERGNPPKGTIKSVVSFKDNGGNRWEYVGTIPLSAASKMIALCASNGKRDCLVNGEDHGISSVWGSL